MKVREMQVYRKLTTEQASYLWSRLAEIKMVFGGQPDTMDKFVEMIDGYSHAQVIMTIASDPKIIAMDIAGVLLEQPIYQCARGETGEELTDIHGRKLRFPLGSRRGEVPNNINPMDIKKTYDITVSDPRIVISIAPNPKRPGTSAYARYELYTINMSVNWHLKSTALTRRDIQYDADKGFIVLERRVRK